MKDEDILKEYLFIYPYLALWAELLFDEDLLEFFLYDEITFPSTATLRICCLDSLGPDTIVSAFLITTSGDR